MHLMSYLPMSQTVVAQSECDDVCSPFASRKSAGEFQERFPDWGIGSYAENIIYFDVKGEYL